MAPGGSVGSAFALHASSGAGYLRDGRDDRGASAGLGAGGDRGLSIWITAFLMPEKYTHKIIDYLQFVCIL